MLFDVVFFKCIAAISRKSFNSMLKLLLSKIGLNPDLWSGHSFRRGGASLLYRLGIDPLTIQACGDWSSDTFLRYLHLSVVKAPYVRLITTGQCGYASI